ncbi:MAG: hypothetical protein AAGF22_07810, partial [Pseudomonadota bacterium]
MQASSPEDQRPSHALSPWLESQNEVLRCAAIRATSGLCEDVDAQRETLLTALMDTDPDVRTDAMEVFAPLARDGDAGTLLLSLSGDPVREVKLAAIAGLGGLQCPEASTLLRSLARSRAEDQVAWEDEDSDWEDWLDIQIVAIKALGQMGDASAIPDLLAARDDEYGQTLDVQVFEALSLMGADGVRALFDILHHETGLARKRVADALASAAPEALALHLDDLLAAPEGQLRALAVTLLPADDPRGAQICHADPDPDVRCASLRHCAAVDPSLPIAALSDPVELVQATALELLPDDLDPAFQATLGDNLLAWVSTSGPTLSAKAARYLARYVPTGALDTLTTTTEDPERPLQTRIAAVQALGRMPEAPKPEDLQTLLANPAHQVRTAALVLLRDLTSAGDALCADLFARAIAGTLLSPEARNLELPDEAGQALGAPKGEGGPRRIRITRDGDIVDDTDHAPEGASTLAAILNDDAVEPVQAEDTPEEAPAKRLKR